MEFRYIIANYFNFFLVYQVCFNKYSNNLDDPSENGYCGPL